MTKREPAPLAYSPMEGIVAHAAVDPKSSPNHVEAMATVIAAVVLNYAQGGIAFKTLEGGREESMLSPDMIADLCELLQRFAVRVAPTLAQDLVETGEGG